MKNIFATIFLTTAISLSPLQGASHALPADSITSHEQKTYSTVFSLKVDQKIFTGADGNLYSATIDNSTGATIVEVYNLEESRLKAKPVVPPQNPCTISVLGVAILALGAAAFAVLAANPAGAVIAGVALTSAELAAIASLLSAGASIQSILSTISCGNK